uniref:Thyroid hormone receptor interactor 10b n=1 Tax=Cyprinus carpio TaxID=7962 RepID=A0A8C2E9W9_CYPCA
MVCLQDQHDVIERHTQSGLDLLERYVKFVKDRAEVEQNYAKQLRNLSKKYSRRGVKEDQDTKLINQQPFQDVLNELNNYAAHREQLSEIMTVNICVELSRNLQELRQERKNHLCEVKKAQQNLESSFKLLETSKKRFEKEWREAEKANQQTERVQQEVSATKADVEKAKQHAHFRVHLADECKNEYALQLQRYNQEQNNLYHSEIPSVYKKLQEMEERCIKLLADGYVQFSETEKNMLPNINKCLDAIISTGRNINEKQETMALIEQYRSGAVPPADVEFEDYSQTVRAAASDNTVTHLPKVRIKQLFHKKNKVGTVWSNSFLLEICIQMCHKQFKTFIHLFWEPPSLEDLSRLPPDQRSRRLQEKINDIQKELQRETEKSEALMKMKGVYEQNSQLGDPSSLQPQIIQIAHNIARLRGELNKYQVHTHTHTHTCIYITVVSDPSVSPSDNIYECEFDDDFDVDVPIGQCTALYDFDGSSEGAVSMQVGEQLSLMQEDQGDGWVRVQRANGDVGYVPASYIQIM